MKVVGTRTSFWPGSTGNGSRHFSLINVFPPSSIAMQTTGLTGIRSPTQASISRCIWAKLRMRRCPGAGSASTFSDEAAVGFF